MSGEKYRKEKDLLHGYSINGVLMIGRFMSGRKFSFSQTVLVNLRVHSTSYELVLEHQKCIFCIHLRGLKIAFFTTFSKVKMLNELKTYVS